MNYPLINELILDGQFVDVRLKNEVRALFAANKRLTEFADRVAATAKANVEHLNKVLGHDDNPEAGKPVRMVCQNSSSKPLNRADLRNGSLYWNMRSMQIVRMYSKDVGIMEGTVVIVNFGVGTGTVALRDLRKATPTEVNNYLNKWAKPYVWQSGEIHPDYKIKGNPVKGRIYFDTFTNTCVRLNSQASYGPNVYVKYPSGTFAWRAKVLLRKATLEEVIKFLEAVQNNNK